MKKLTLTIGLLLISSLSCAQDAIYHAVIDGRGDALISVRTIAGKMTGGVHYDSGDVDVLELARKPAARGAFKWEETLGAPKGTFAGTLGRDGKSGQGTWTSDRGGKAVPFTLTRVGTVRTLDGGKVAASVSYPQLDDPHFARLNQRLTATARKMFADNVETAKGSDGRGGDAEASTNCELDSVTQDRVSVICDSLWSTGGVHPNGGQEAFNYRVAANGAIKSFGLWDVLSKSPANVKNLSLLVFTDFQQQRKSRASDGNPGDPYMDLNGLDQALAGDEIAFTVVPAGLAFALFPYQASTWAEGNFRVVVPNSKLASLYRRDGPLADRANAVQPSGRKSTP